MSELILPLETQPQVSDLAYQELAAAVAADGIIAVSRPAFSKLEDSEPKLTEQLEVMGYALTRLAPELPWQDRMLRIGAVVAWQAYKETGYYQSIDPSLDIGMLMAEMDGVPESYFISICGDRNLMSLMNAVRSAPDLRIIEPTQHQHILDMGAGYTRFYLQTALAAAA